MPEVCERLKAGGSTASDDPPAALCRKNTFIPCCFARMLEYDIDAAISGLQECGLTGESLELARSVLQRGGKPPSAASGG